MSEATDKARAWARFQDKQGRTQSDLGCVWPHLDSAPAPHQHDYRSLLFEAIRARQVVSLDQIDEVIDAVLSVDRAPADGRQ